MALIVSLALGILLPVASARQPDLTGLLIDPSGRPVAGIAVSLASAAGERQAFTGPDGAFRFEDLAPGSYRLRADVHGFNPVERAIRVGNQPVSRVLLRLALAPLKQEVLVPGEDSQVNTEAAGNLNAVSVERGLLENLPVLGLDYLAALSRFLDPGAPGGTGASLIVDGMEARNVGVTPSAIQEIKINQNPYTAEYPRWSRRRIEVITKTGTESYHGTVNFLFRDHHLNTRDAFAVTRPPERRRIFEGSLFGPLSGGKRSSFLLSGLRESEDLQAVVYARGPEGSIARNVATPQQNTLLSLRISHQLSDGQAIFWQVNTQDRWQNNAGVGGTVLPEAGTRIRLREDEFVLNHRAVITPKLLSQFRILLGRYSSPTHSNVDAPRVVVSDAFTGGGAQADGLRTEVHTSITWLLTHTVRKHTLKYGFNVPDWSRRGLSDRSNTLGTFSFATLDDYRLGRPFSTVLQQGDPRTVFVEKNLGAFFQDEWQVRPGLSIAGGLRYDWQNYFHDRNNVSPRISLAFAPTRRRDWVVRAGAGFFYDRSGPAPIWDILRFDGVRLRRFVITGDSGPAPGITRLAPGIQLPEVLQFNAGIERQVAKKTTLAVNYVGTRAWYQLRSRDGNAPLPPTFAARPDPRFSVLRTIESACRMESNALEVTLKGTLGPKITGLAQYNFGRTLADTGGVNWFPADSFDPRGEWARADSDRRHQFNLLGAATLHRWLNFGLSISLLSGMPYNITTGGDQNRDGIANDRPRGIARNTGAGPDYFGLDLRWYREFRLKPVSKEAGPSGILAVDAFNLPNRVNYQNYLGALSSPFFGRPVSANPPRRLQLSLRFQF